jgi:hypothetical protein
VAGAVVTTNPAADVIVGLCSVASAAIGFAAASRAARHDQDRPRRRARAARHAGAPSAAASTVQVAGTVDLTVTFTEPEGRHPRMPIRRGHERREERRERRRVRAGDSYTADDEVDLEAPDPDAAAPPEADQVGPDEHEGGPDDDGRH